MKLLLRRTAALLAAVFFAAPACAQDAVLTADEIAAAVHSVDLALDRQCRQKINRLVGGYGTRSGESGALR